MGWKSYLNCHAIRPIQKFSYTKSKNSTDTALIIDAMDLMHSKVVDGFCIISSDSDFTGLAHRIREEGCFVMGIGAIHTPEAFIKSCVTFTYSHILKLSYTYPQNSHSRVTNIVSHSDSGSDNQASNANVHKRHKILDLKLFRNAFDIVVDINTGLALYSRLSERLKSNDATFDPRSYGHRTFKLFCESIPGYETVTTSDNSTLYLYEKTENNKKTRKRNRTN